MIAALALALAIGPLLLTLANLAALRRPPLPHFVPDLSVLIPARNEEANIASACAAILASTGVTLELLVLDDGSTDRTAAILAAIPDPRLRVFQGHGLPPGWSGKQHACAVLAREARHDLMVFVDADVRLAPDALARMAGFMQRRPSLGLASGFPRQVTLGWSEILLLPLIHFMLMGFLPIAAMRRSPGVALGAGCGQLFIARRDAYVRAGGHEAIRASLHDGLTLPRAFRRAGRHTDLFDATGLARCRMYSSAGALWEGLCKNATEGMAKPIALPIWTLILAGGQIAPWPLLLLTPSYSIPWSLAAAAASCGIAVRLLLAIRFRQSLLSALLHPLGILALLVIQWWSLLRAWRGGKPTWRGRAYTAQS